uniref:Uncharacterized protein n=1 Tax=viral metagenome TaxID=1070528 RepID=A0A6C0IAG4_9ZZZZ
MCSEQVPAAGAALDTLVLVRLARAGLGGSLHLRLGERGGSGRLLADLLRSGRASQSGLVGSQDGLRVRDSSAEGLGGEREGDGGGHLVDWWGGGNTLEWIRL